MTGIIGHFLIKADNVCDYIPIVSSINNLIDLFQKYIVIPRMDNSSVANSHYYTHLQQKDFCRCIVLVFPVIGNVIVGLSDWSANEEFEIAKKAWLTDRLGNKHAIRDASSALQGDKNAIFKAAKDNSMSDYVSQLIQNSKRVMLAIVKQDGTQLSLASKELQNDEEIVLAAVRQYKHEFMHVNEQFKDNKNVALAAVEQEGALLGYASARLKDDKEVVLAAVKQNRLALKFASARLENDGDLLTLTTSST